MTYNYQNNSYAIKSRTKSNNTNYIAVDRFNGQKLNLSKPPKILNKYKKYGHDMKREFEWTYTPPPR